MKLSIIALLLLFCSVTVAQSTAPLNVTISGVKEQTGSILVAVYNSKDTFQKEPHLTLAVPVDSGSPSFSIDTLPVGEFAILVFQDLDSNNKMKTNLVGMPKEPWGASLQGKSLFGPPKWKHVKFSHAHTGTSMNIQLH